MGEIPYCHSQDLFKAREDMLRAGVTDAQAHAIHRFIIAVIEVDRDVRREEPPDEPEPDSDERWIRATNEWWEHFFNEGYKSEYGADK